MIDETPYLLQGFVLPRYHKYWFPYTLYNRESILGNEIPDIFSCSDTLFIEGGLGFCNEKNHRHAYAEIYPLYVEYSEEHRYMKNMADSFNIGKSVLYNDGREATILYIEPFTLEVMVECSDGGVIGNHITQFSLIEKAN